MDVSSPTACRLRCDVLLVALALLLTRFSIANEQRGTVFVQSGSSDHGKSNAIQSALLALPAKGTRCLVLPKGTHRSGPIRLPRCTELYLAKGATLVMSGDPDTYPTDDNGERPALITIDGVSDVRITGEGLIDGNGAAWWKAFRDARAAGSDLRRPQLIRINRSTNIEISGISTINPPNTHVSARDSDRVVFRGLTMTAPDESPNTDAINLGRMKQVLIDECEISTGDDNVAIIASGRPGETAASEDITVRNCRFGFGHGLSIGSYTAAGIRRVRVENVSFNGTTSGIRLKSHAGRGGVVRDLEYRRLTMNNVRYPIFLSSHYPRLPAQPGAEKAGGESVPQWSDILIEDVTIRACRNGPIIWGLPDAPIKNLALRNVAIEAEQGGVIVHGEASFENVSITVAHGEPVRTFDATVRGIATAPLAGVFKAK